jgi:hypothetical protein
MQYMKVIILTVLLAILAVSCRQPEQSPGTKVPKQLEFTLEQANNLAQLPLACMQKEYPNKPGETLGGAEDLGEPRELHPAFYGCFDWHSSVHGHWSLVWLLKHFPELEREQEIREKLEANLSAGNILGEVAYFQGPHSLTYERTYGWAWLLKLAEELHTWDDSLGRKLERNLEPLTELMVQRYMEYLPKLVYPIRVGEHSNTAFGLCFAWDYARTAGADSLKILIESRSREFYGDDSGCPLGWEPGGNDFLSPCFEEIDLMRRVLDEDEFDTWMEQFMPELGEKTFHLDPGIVSDRSDGKLIHLDGLNFSRAWVLYSLAGQYPQYGHLVELADEHMQYSFPNLAGDTYEGGHWLGSFAIYALDRRAYPISF